jgi:hypothetical protein
MPATTCIECNAWYDSEAELNAHLSRVHRRLASVQSSSQAVEAVVYPEKGIEEIE